MSLHLSVIRTDDELAALEPEWDELFRHHGLSVFQSFEWNQAWWRHVAAHARPELHVVIVREGDVLVGLAPLVLEDFGVAGVGIKRLAFMGRELSDYLDVVVAPAREREVIDVIAGHLVDRSELFDVAVLEDIPDRARTAVTLVEALARRGVPTQTFANERCPRTKLLGTWDATLAAWKLDHRRELRRRRRNLEKAAHIELEIRGDPTTIEADMAEFIAMHQERWTASGHRGALAVDRVQRFHLDAARALSRRGWTFLAFLRVDGQRAGVVYGFRFRGELSIYLTGMRDVRDLRRHSPGRVLAGLCMEHAAGEGVSTYDFMRGSEQYKYELEGEDIVNRTVLFAGCRAALPRHRHRAVLLGCSLQRRTEREVLLWRHAAKAGRGVLHLRTRIGVIVRDGWLKLTAPERSLSAPR